MKKNVLVFPCGSEIGLEIFRSISSSMHFNVYGGSSASDHGEFVYKNYIGDIPYIEDKDFLDTLNSIIKEYNIDYIFPAHDSVVLELAKQKACGKLLCDVVTSPLETCEIARSKKKTYEFFQNTLPVPTVFNSTAEITSRDMPVFLKPDVGQGSKGTHKVDDLEDVPFYLKKDPSLLMLEYLPGREYTVDCFTNYKGNLIYCEGRERGRISNGISVRSAIHADVRFAQLAEIINSNLAFRGAWFFQVKEGTDGELVLMEIAPRIAGTMGLARCRGVNLALLSLFDAQGIDVEIIENNYWIEIDRALEAKYKHNINYEHVYIDLDDIVLTNGKVNVSIIAFIYQCINNRKHLHLVTRHRDNLEDTLVRHRLSGIFDDVECIKDDGCKKSAFIKEKRAIFIDDSFVERKDVSEQCSIPVFDLHMIEGLME